MTGVLIRRREETQGRDTEKTEAETEQMSL